MLGMIEGFTISLGKRNVDLRSPLKVIGGTQSGNVTCTEGYESLRLRLTDPRQESLADDPAKVKACTRLLRLGDSLLFCTMLAEPSAALGSSGSHVLRTDEEMLSLLPPPPLAEDKTGWLLDCDDPGDDFSGDANSCNSGLSLCSFLFWPACVRIAVLNLSP